MVDPKPDAPDDFRGPFGTIATKTSGMHFTELLPRMAARSDKYTVIRSMQTTNGGHPGAGTVGVTGFEEKPGPVQPNFGAIVAKHRGQQERCRRSFTSVAEFHATCLGELKVTEVHTGQSLRSVSGALFRAW